MLIILLELVTGNIHLSLYTKYCILVRTYIGASMIYSVILGKWDLVHVWQ